MKTLLEPEDIQAIAEAVATKLSQGSVPDNRQEVEDDIMDVRGLAAYLKVDITWVYRQVQSKTIPHFHAGRYPRFHRGQIGRWIKEQSTPAATATYPRLKRAA